MNLIDFDLSFVKEETYLNTYIDFLMSQSGKSLQYNLKAMDLPNSSYHYCRKNGFKNSYFTLEIIGKYFGVSFDIDEKILKELEDLLSRSFTESFFVDGDKLREIEKEIAKYESVCAHTILEPIYYLVYACTLDLPASTDKYKEIIPNKVVPTIMAMYESFPDNIKYVYSDMISQYYQATDELDEYPALIDELERLDPYVDERLKTIGHYDLITMYFETNNIESAYKYSKSCQQLYLKYFNSKRLNYIEKSLAALAFKCQRYDEVVILARNNLLFVSRDETKPVFYKQLIMLLVVALIRTKKYEEAIKSADMFYEKQFTDYYTHAMLLKMYSYLKMRKKEEFNSLYKEIKKEKDENVLILADLMLGLLENKKKNMVGFGKRLKPVYANPFNGYRQICELLKLDYIDYLKKTKKYIDVLDM